MNAWSSWAIFLAIVGGLSWHYAGRPNLLQRLTSTSYPTRDSPAAKTNTRKSKPKAKDDESSLTEANTNRKRKMATPQPGNNVGKSQMGPGGDGRSTATDQKTTEKLSRKDADFAREMALARVGTQLSAVGKSGAKKVEGLAQNQEENQATREMDSPSQSTGASSTTGADADDDLSPAASPQLAGSHTAATSITGEPSDMLEARTGGPSILRLTEPVNPVTATKGKTVSKVFEPAETKKQRQHRIKRENQRAEAEVVERERRRLLEQQIRGARMAEGTSKQTRTSGFKAPTENAWLAGPGQASATAPKATSNGTQPLLDTFDQKSEAVGSKGGQNRTVHIASGDLPGAQPEVDGQAKEQSSGSKGAAGPKPGGLGASLKTPTTWTKDLPVEEEQIRLIQDSQDSWTTVSKRDKKKSSKLIVGQENDSGEASSAESRNGNRSGQQEANTTVENAIPSNNANTYQKVGASSSRDSGFHDSDWAA